MNCEFTENDIKEYCKAANAPTKLIAQFLCSWLIITGLVYLVDELNITLIGKSYFLLLNLFIIIISILIVYFLSLWIYHKTWTKLWNTIEKTFTIETSFDEIKLIYPNGNFTVIKWDALNTYKITNGIMCISYFVFSAQLIPLRCIDDKVKQDIFDALMNIHLGITDDKVKEVQDSLIALGYEVTDTEKLFGDSTLKSVKKLQEANNLKIDGIVGPKTYKLLKNFK